MPVKKVTRSTSSGQATKKSTVIPSETRNLKIKTTRKTGSLSISVYSLAGRATGTMSLPKEIFGQKVNKTLLAQALRVYMTNQKEHRGSTKTRGEVRGSTAKIWRQKGTGRARHGAKTAPIFVGGGVVFGPEVRKVKLELPKKMKKAALVSALSNKMEEKQILGISGLEKSSGKTKEMALFLKKLSVSSALIVTDEKYDNVVRGVRNILGVEVMPVNQINAYEVLKYKVLLVTKDSIATLQSDMKGKTK